MKHFLDTGPLVALLNRRDPHHAWAADTLRCARWPLFTCESVLTEATHLLGDAAPVLELVEAGDLVVEFSASDHASEILRLLRQFSDRDMGLADACLVRMTEVWRDSLVLTIDRQDFQVYRRRGREPIPFLAPP